MKAETEGKLTVCWRCSGYGYRKLQGTSGMLDNQPCKLCLGHGVINLLSSPADTDSINADAKV
jgi:hypothetical protein